MALFIPTIPQANDNLDFSQGQLLTNNAGLDTVFGIDHYTFSDATANKGFHNQVTTPSHIGGHPATGANPILYSMQDSAFLGVIQYSKAPNLLAADPSSPITMKQSPLTASTVPGPGLLGIFDFSGLTRSLAILVAADTTTNNKAVAFVVWTTVPGNSLTVATIVGSSALFAAVSGTTLILQNTTGTPQANVYWTLQFMRTQ